MAVSVATMCSYLSHLKTIHKNPPSLPYLYLLQKLYGFAMQTKHKKEMWCNANYICSQCEFRTCMYIKSHGCNSNFFLSASVPMFAPVSFRYSHYYQLLSGGGPKMLVFYKITVMFIMHIRIRLVN